MSRCIWHLEKILAQWLRHLAVKAYCVVLFCGVFTTYAKPDHSPSPASDETYHLQADLSLSISRKKRALTLTNKTQSRPSEKVTTWTSLLRLRPCYFCVNLREELLPVVSGSPPPEAERLCRLFLARCKTDKKPGFCLQHVWLLALDWLTYCFWAATRQRRRRLVGSWNCNVPSTTLGWREERRRHSSGAVWESRWPSWAVRPNEPSDFRGRKAILNHASALVSACPWYVNLHPRTLSNTTAARRRWRRRGGGGEEGKAGRRKKRLLLYKPSA